MGALGVEAGAGGGCGLKAEGRALEVRPRAGDGQARGAEERAEELREGVGLLFGRNQVFPLQGPGGLYGAGPGRSGRVVRGRAGIDACDADGRAVPPGDGGELVLERVGVLVDGAVRAHDEVGPGSAFPHDVHAGAGA